ncbi:MAG: thioredoxin family protein [Lachnospiraceae bacterium]
MIEKEGIPQKSPLITEELEGQLKPVLDKLTENIEVVCVMEPQETSSKEMAGMIRHIEGMCPKISGKFCEKDEAMEQYPEIDTTLLPATAIYKDGQYTGLAFHGVTGGKEMNSLIFALYNTAGPKQDLNKKLKESIQKLPHKIEIKILVSLSCHHCAQQVIACQRIAAESPMVEARMIDARLYPWLAEQYKIERIPMTIINENEIVLGTKTVEELYDKLKQC